MLEPGFYNMDCMEGMKQFPDNYFDLAVVDPPYGGAGRDEYNRFGGNFEKYKDGSALQSVCRTGGGHNKYDRKIITWDVAPGKAYFDELFRVSKNQIIWGGTTLNCRQRVVFLFGAS